MPASGIAITAAGAGLDLVGLARVGTGFATSPPSARSNPAVADIRREPATGDTAMDRIILIFLRE